jgi:hypothetical protein
MLEILGFGVIFYYVLVNWSAVTGGPSGLIGIPPLALGRVRLDTDARAFWLAWGCLVGVQARRRIHEVVGITADVSVVLPRTIERSVGKAKRVLDLRGAGE